MCNVYMELNPKVIEIWKKIVTMETMNFFWNLKSWAQTYTWRIGQNFVFKCKNWETSCSFNKEEPNNMAWMDMAKIFWSFSEIIVLLFSQAFCVVWCHVSFDNKIWMMGLLSSKVLMNALDFSVSIWWKVRWAHMQGASYIYIMELKEMVTFGTICEN